MPRSDPGQSLGVGCGHFVFKFLDDGNYRKLRSPGVIIV